MELIEDVFKSTKIYNFILTKVKELREHILKMQLFDEEAKEKQKEIKSRLDIIVNKLEKKIKELENNSEWDRFTVAFYGETNAGKSTLIETLRIMLNEKEKLKDREKYKEIEDHINSLKNQKGVYDDKIKEIVKKRSHAFMHVDMTQAIGKIPCALDQIDLASISAHKIEGLKGSGILIKKEHVPMEPLISGGEQEFGLRGGTANAVANMVFAKTLRLALENEKKMGAYVKGLQEHMIAGLRERKEIMLNSPANSVGCLVNFSCTSIPGEVMQNALNRAGFMVSGRSTCESRSLNPSHVLKAMGFSDSRASSCIRVSLSRHNTIEEVDAFLNALQEIIERYGKV